MMLTSAFIAAVVAVVPSFAFPSIHGSHAVPEHSTADNGEPMVRTLYQYPKDTWIENIAVRENGSLLLTLLTTPHLDSLNPFEIDATPYTVYTFPNAAGVSGIAETAPDTFAMAVGNLSFTTGPTQGSWSIWSVGLNEDADGAAVSAHQIVKVPEAVFFDGVCNLPSSLRSKNLLVGDAATGVVYYVDSTTGQYHIAINNTLTSAVPVPVLGTAGVNGIHVLDDTLFFANIGQGVFAKMPISANGAPLGRPSVIAHTLNSSLEFDDFAIKDGYAYLVTGSGNSIERIGLDGTPQGRIIVGTLNSTELAEPTSCAFGRMPRDRHVLYVVTTGGLAVPVDGDITVGAQVLAVNTERWGH